MLLLNPNNYHREHADAQSRQLVEKTIAFFENKGLRRIKEDDQSMVWYEDFLQFIKEEGVFADLLTPAAYGEGRPGRRWDMWRISEFNEILAFYGLCYWYAWQVTILGLGARSGWADNEEAKRRTARLLANGGVFAFGLSERAHGADLYSTEMTLTRPATAVGWPTARNTISATATCAALVSTFGRIAGTGEYVFFVVDPQEPQYECVKKIDTSGSARPTSPNTPCTTTR